MRKHRVVIAKGEATGHAHVAEGETLTMEDGVLDSPREAKVTHQEHGVVRVPPGRHSVRRVKEYDHFKEEARVVRD